MTTTLLTLRDYIPNRLLARNSDLATTAVVDDVIRDAQLRLIEDLEGNEAFTTTVPSQPIAANTGDLNLDEAGQFEVHGVLLIEGWGSGDDLVTQWEQARRPIERMDYAAAWALYGNATGAPQVYARHGFPRPHSTHPLDYTSDGLWALFRVFPAPAAEMRADVLVDRRPPLLTELAPTNVLTEQFERALRAACLLEGALFMRDFGGAAVDRYQEAYVQALSAAVMRLGRRKQDRGGVRRRDISNISGPGVQNG